MKKLILAAVLTFTCLGAFAATSAPAKPAKPVEVVEFFSYGCPHCAHLAPELEAWVAKQGGAVTFKRVPVGFGRTTWYRLGLMYQALEDIGRMTPELHLEIFKAIHEKHFDLDKAEVMEKWLVAHKVDMPAYAKAFNKSSQKTRMEMAERRLIEKGATGVPAILVDNKYLVPSTTPADVIRKVDSLAKLRK